jgi:uncharacterized HTH-type transcriptional regulator MJ0568
MAKTEDRLSESMEDYLETILLLSAGEKTVRAVDIAKSKGVAKASVSVVLCKLCEMGYLNYEKYLPVSLTPKGVNLAKRTLSKHKILIEFLNKTLGISQKESEIAACKIEHAIGRKIATKISMLSKRNMKENFDKTERKSE